MELYFIRHGQSQNNANWNDPQYQESPDPALTATGVEQARALAEYLHKNNPITPHRGWNVQNRYGFGLTHLYTSLMERAVQTATPTAMVLDVPFIAWPEIHEGGGIFTRDPQAEIRGLPGKPRAYFTKHTPTLKLPDWLDESGWWNRPFEEEEQRPARARKFLADLLARHGDQEGRPEHRVAIVSHGGFFMHLMCAMLKLPWRQAAHNMESWFLLSNCSISRFDIRSNEIIISYLNRTDHLPDHLITG